MVSCPSVLYCTGCVFLSLPMYDSHEATPSPFSSLPFSPPSLSSTTLFPALFSAVPLATHRRDGNAVAPGHVCPADPLPHLSIKVTPIETSSAQYILQQYTASFGGQKLLSSIRNAYAMGKVRMVASKFEIATRVVKNRNVFQSRVDLCSGKSIPTCGL